MSDDEIIKYSNSDDTNKVEGGVMLFKHSWEEPHVLSTDVYILTLYSHVDTHQSLTAHSLNILVIKI